MNKNIFYNAYFGKAYETRDGRKAIFSHTEYSEEDNEIFAYLMIENKGVSGCSESELNCLLVSLDGTWHSKKYESENDIVSEWQEINEEELKKLADEYCGTKYFEDEFEYTRIQNAFNAGVSKRKK